jgi:hypothetical protein
MGGGSGGNRASYAEAALDITTLDDYDSAQKRVFISFHMEDEAQVNLLRQQAKDEQSSMRFTDYSVKEPFDEKWKTKATERIKRSSLVIVMVGPETHKREAVNWEINKAYELGKKVVCVRIYRNENHQIPQACKDHNAKVISWNLKVIKRELEKE